MSLNTQITEVVEVVDIIFFPSNTNGTKFMNFLETATTSILLHINSIPISIFGVFTENDKIANILINLSNKGVKIQIVTDDICFKENDGKKSNLSKFCDIIYIDDDSLVSDKYAIIDDTYFLSGSFDWVYKSFETKYQDIYIIKSDKFVTEYKNYFLNIWKVY
jgi:hypothetical protein